MTGARTLPWRYACPAGHQGLHRQRGRVYCQSCGQDYAAVVDLKHDREVDADAAGRKVSGTV